MKAVDFEDTVRRRADRLRGSASHLIDDGQSAANAKLNEAVVIIQGAFAHLLEESQELIRAKMAEASYVLQQSRERAAQGVRHAVDHARDQAEELLWRVAQDGADTSVGHGRRRHRAGRRRGAGPSPPKVCRRSDGEGRP